MNPASTSTRSLTHLACAGQTAGMWHAIVRPLVANFRKENRTRRDEIVME